MTDNNLNEAMIQDEIMMEELSSMRAKKHNKYVMNTCCCLICLFIMVFTNYISFCMGVIYFQRDGSLSNSYIL